MDGLQLLLQAGEARLLIINYEWLLSALNCKYGSTTEAWNLVILHRLH